MTSKIISFDPGINTGVAVLVNGALQDVYTIHPMQIYETIHSSYADGVVFEDSRLQSYVWTRGVSIAAGAKMARNVGMVDAWCCLIEEVCKQLDMRCLGISPKNKGRKMNHAQFEKMTGHSDRTNQHERDAAAVVWPYRNGWR